MRILLSSLTLVVVVVVIVVPMACTSESSGEGEGEGGEGEGEGEPLVESDEAICELGVVILDQTAECTLTLRNRGTAPATLEGATTSAPFAIVDDVNGTLLPGAVDSAVLRVSGTPTTSGTIESTVSITIAESAPLVVPVRMTGQCVPQAILVAPESALVGEDVILDATTSVPCDGDTLGFEWTVVSQPSAADTLVTSEGNAIFTVRSNALGDVEIAVDVIASSGFSDEATARIAFEPRLTLSVENAIVLGLEPHVFRSAGERCTSTDCFDGAGCGFTASSPPEWDGAAGRTAGDPLFEESAGVFVPAPVDGDYVVAVYARAAANAAVTLGVDGIITNDERSLAANELWTLATINVSGGAATATTVDTVEANVTCP